MSAPTTVYVTKDAITTGIVQITAKVAGNGYAQECMGDGTAPSWYGCFKPSEFRATLADAVEDAERRRAVKLENLRRQIADLEAKNLTSPAVVR